MDWQDLVGYSASFFLIISFMFKDIIKLRIFNTLGCVLFIVYGVLLDLNWPIIIPNVFISSVNIYQLLKAQKAVSS
ncbi:MAG: uroporphyrinogen decarboxylase [Flavobacteriales bacterium]|nr:uroporphyrinogen decarboxylase [Flavobacteriales bacterium]